MEPPKEMRESKASKPEELEKRLLSLGALRVEVRSDAEVDRVREQGRELAKRLGCSAFDATLIATVVSELARNIVAYGRQSKIVLHGEGKNTSAEITILACDQGLGITDAALAMQKGHSNGAGLGLGLRAVKRIMDEFEIVSHAAKGATVIAKKWLRVPEPPYKRVGAAASADHRGENRFCASP